MTENWFSNLDYIPKLESVLDQESKGTEQDSKVGTASPHLVRKPDNTRNAGTDPIVDSS